MNKLSLYQASKLIALFVVLLIFSNNILLPHYTSADVSRIQDFLTVTLIALMCSAAFALVVRKEWFELKIGISDILFAIVILAPVTVTFYRVMLLTGFMGGL